MTIDTSLYGRTHGRNPFKTGQRSIGYWMFKAVRDDGAIHQFSFRGSYAEVLKYAKGMMKTIGGFDTLIVMP